MLIGSLETEQLLEFWNFCSICSAQSSLYLFSHNLQSFVLLMQRLVLRQFKKSLFIFKDFLLSGTLTYKFSAASASPTLISMVTIIFLYSSFLHYNLEGAYKRKAEQLCVSFHIFPFPQNLHFCIGCCPTSKNICFIYFVQSSNCLCMEGTLKWLVCYDLKMTLTFINFNDNVMRNFNS